MNRFHLALIVLLLAGAAHAGDPPHDFIFIVPRTIQVVPATPAPVAPAAPAVATPPVSTPIANSSAVSLERVAGILKASCQRCHSAPAPKGKVTLFSDTGVFGSSVPAQDIVEAVETGAMPKGAGPLSPSDVALLKQWAASPTTAAPVPVGLTTADENKAILEAIRNLGRRLRALEERLPPSPTATRAPAPASTPESLPPTNQPPRRP